jgi:hypothetical protein
MEQFNGSLFGKARSSGYVSKMQQQLALDGCSNMMPPPCFFPTNMGKEPKRKVIYVATLYEDYCKYAIIVIYIVIFIN